MGEETVRRWCRMFKDWRTNVHDKKRRGRPTIYSEWWSCSKCWPKNLWKTAFHNFRISCEFRQISCSLLYEIITVRLGYHKRCATWVPKILTDVYKTQRMASALTFSEQYHTDGYEFLNYIVRETDDETWD
jgi:hypothetical protein